MNSPEFSNKPKKFSSASESNPSGANPNINVRDPKHTAGPSNGKESWQEGRKQHHPEHGNKRERSKREWRRERDRSSRRWRENFYSDESKECPEPVFHNYDPNYAENNQQQLITSDISPYGMIAAMNSPPWGMGPVKRMNMNLPPAVMNTNLAAVDMNSFNSMGMPADQNVYGVMGMGNYGQYGMVNGEGKMLPPAKKMLYFSKCVLYPPNSSAGPPTAREKPPWCKTVFVDGLPKNTTQEIIREVFEKCGEILNITMSEENFCHITFAAENFIENPICFSGYRIKIENKDDAPNTGWLRVDYVNSSDDQYKYEYLQHSLQQEACHHEQIKQEILRPPSPPIVVHFSDHESSIMNKMLRNEEMFLEAATNLTTWFERGECNKKNASSFYSFLQNCNSHVRYLQNEKKKADEAREIAEALHRKRMQSILVQYSEVKKIYTAAKLQKTRDQFTKPQRKTVDSWEKDLNAARTTHIAEVVKDRVEDEMDVSDSEGGEDTPNSEEAMLTVTDLSGNKINQNDQKLREEIDILRCQLVAAENKLDLVKAEADQERKSRSQQMVLQEDVQRNMDHEIQLFIKQNTKNELELQALKLKLETYTKLENEKEIGESSDEPENDKNLNIQDIAEPLVENEVDILAFASSVTAAPNNLVTTTEYDIKLICLIAMFLNVNPYGASIDFICSWLHKQNNIIVLARDVESLMQRYSYVFREMSTGIGASLQRKWIFLAMDR